MEPGTPPPPRHLEMSRRRTQALIPARFRVWLAVLKYHVTPFDEPECVTRLQVWDGNIRASPSCNEIYWSVILCCVWQMKHNQKIMLFVGNNYCYTSKLHLSRLYLFTRVYFTSATIIIVVPTNTNVTIRNVVI